MCGPSLVGVSKIISQLFHSSEGGQEITCTRLRVRTSKQMISRLSWGHACVQVTMHRPHVAALLRLERTTLAASSEPLSAAPACLAGRWLRPFGCLEALRPLPCLAGGSSSPEDALLRAASFAGDAASGSDSDASLLADFKASACSLPDLVAASPMTSQSESSPSDAASSDDESSAAAPAALRPRFGCSIADAPSLSLPGSSSVPASIITCQGLMNAHKQASLLFWLCRQSSCAETLKSKLCHMVMVLQAVISAWRVSGLSQHLPTDSLGLSPGSDSEEVSPALANSWRAALLRPARAALARGSVFASGSICGSALAATSLFTSPSCQGTRRILRTKNTIPHQMQHGAKGRL